MYGASAEFYREIARSHTGLVRVVATTGTDELTLDVEGGQGLTIDYDTPTRRALSLALRDESSTAAELADLVDVFATVWRYDRGVRYADGTEEWVPCGQFYAERVELAESNDGAVTLSLDAYDASTRCQGPLDGPFYIAAGSKADVVVPQLLGRKMPALRYRLASSAWTLPALNLRNQVNPWTKARELFAAMGYELTIDRDGVCVSDARAVTVLDDPVWQFVEGDNATFAPGASRSVAAEDYPNVVVVKGTNAATGTAVRGEAADLDPASPTYRYGPTGERVLEVESEKVTSNEQATAMARALLSRELGPQEQVQFRALVNPGLEPPDVVSVTRERLGLEDRRMIVTRIEMPPTFEENATMLVTARRSILTDSAGVVGRQ